MTNEVKKEIWSDKISQLGTTREKSSSYFVLFF